MPRNPRGTSLISDCFKYSAQRRTSRSKLSGIYPSPGAPAFPTPSRSHVPVGVLMVVEIVERCP